MEAVKLEFLNDVFSVFPGQDYYLLRRTYVGINELVDALVTLELDPVGPTVIEELAVRLGMDEMMPEVTLAMLELGAVGLNVVQLAVRLDTDGMILEDNGAVGPAVLLKFMEMEGPIDGLEVEDQLAVVVVAFSGRVVFIRTALIAAGFGSGKFIALGVLR